MIVAMMNRRRVVAMVITATVQLWRHTRDLSHRMKSRNARVPVRTLRPAASQLLAVLNCREPQKTLRENDHGQIVLNPEVLPSCYSLVLQVMCPVPDARQLWPAHVISVLLSRDRLSISDVRQIRPRESFLCFADMRAPSLGLCPSHDWPLDDRYSGQMFCSRVPLQVWSIQTVATTRTAVTHPVAESDRILLYFTRSFLFPLFLNFKWYSHCTACYGHRWQSSGNSCLPPCVTPQSKGF
jgi:hypothetical protein